MPTLINKTIAVLLSATLLVPSLATACVMDGIGSGALYQVPKQTFSLQLATAQAINAGKIKVAVGGRYEQRMMMLMFQLQQQLSSRNEGEWFLFESSKGHYYKIIASDSRISIKQHEVPQGESEESIIIDVDVLSAIVSKQINATQAVELGILHLPNDAHSLLIS
ncbi:hypothetical protein [Vibrio breoganii]|uniref:hypothetical protein n=1 Tax=Vibrio breoganii TaxID=553239 RepID=UPI000C849548|nr:hypothetical protein [Vibrio breoganii]PML96028.1 hypothetical protein BCT64_08675 [Vibrio breoganii]PMN57686.1 hypothetical protein BCT28_15840 [Vibrio breoganii]